jgi:hypothetical protein
MSRSSAALRPLRMWALAAPIVMAAVVLPIHPAKSTDMGVCRPVSPQEARELMVERGLDVPVEAWPDASDSQCWDSQGVLPTIFMDGLDDAPDRILSFFVANSDEEFARKRLNFLSNRESWEQVLVIRGAGTTSASIVIFTNS